jgi:hypothetical protein
VRSFFAWSAWAHSATVVVSMTSKGPALASNPSVGVDSACLVVAGTTCEGAVIVSLRSFGLG